MQTRTDPLPDMSGEPALPPLGNAPNVLMVWPWFEPSFWGFEGMLEMTPTDVVHPPLGLVTVAALCPASWNMRLIDMNFEELTDSDLAWADLVMVSGMRTQDDEMREVLARARALGRRTIIGGPLASAEPDPWQDLADHVVVGEPDEMFAEIARDLEQGTARRRYVVEEKPDLRNTPAPRYDLLKMHKYLVMSVQVSRGCPFTCEFCDIITIYGRRPRVKPAEQVIDELERLLALGWRGRVTIASDNFVADHRQSLALAKELRRWQEAHRWPFMFSCEASMDLAQRPELIQAMVEANFASLFIGIESPSSEALTETKKLQNLRQDPLQALATIRQGGLWITGGFIVGFDSDTADIFDRQVEFIERAAIPWAMTNLLNALPTTPLYARMEKEGRLIATPRGNGYFKPPNFRTIMPLPVLLRGQQGLLRRLYEPTAFYDRAFRSLMDWRTSPHQHMPAQRSLALLLVVVRSILEQGIRSSYRRAYWKFLFQVLRHLRDHPVKRRQAIVVLLSGHHFIRYAQTVVDELEQALRELPAEEKAAA